MWGDGIQAPGKGEVITAEFLQKLADAARQHGALGEGFFSGFGFAGRRRIPKKGPRIAWATVYGGAVATSDTTFEVTDIVPCDGFDWDGDDPLEVKNDPDEYEIADEARGKIIYCFDDDDEWAWHPLDFPCA